MVTWPNHAPFRDGFIDRLGHAKIDLPTKFGVPIFTRYGNIKCIAKCRNWGGLGWLEVTPANRQCHHLIEHIRLLVFIWLE